MKMSTARPFILIVCSLAFLLSGCSMVDKAKVYVESFQKKYANPNDACTFLSGHQISEATGDKILSKEQTARSSTSDSSTSSTASTAGTAYDCSYNLSSTEGGFQQANMEVHVISPDTYNSLADKNNYDMTSTETGGSANGSVKGFSGNHAAAYWDPTENTLFEMRKGYAISIKVPFTHSTLNAMDADKDLAKDIFENLPSK